MRYEQIKPAPRLWEAQFLCTYQDQHLQSDWGHAGSSQPSETWKAWSQTVVDAYLHTSITNVEKYKLIPGHWSYKIAKLAPFLFSSLLLPSRSLQTRKADCYPQLKISKEYEWLTTTIIPAWPEIMPSRLILFNLDGMQAPQHRTCLSICFCCCFQKMPCRSMHESG